MFYWFSSDTNVSTANIHGLDRRGQRVGQIIESRCFGHGHDYLNSRIEAILLLAIVPVLTCRKTAEVRRVPTAVSCIFFVQNGNCGTLGYFSVIVNTLVPRCLLRLFPVVIGSRFRAGTHLRDHAGDIVGLILRHLPLPSWPPRPSPALLS
jgi:hypothetical protein